MLLTARDLHKNYGMKQLLSGVSLYLDAGQKLGVIGVNGTGKSTLLKVLAKEEEPDEGSVRYDPNVKFSYLPQDPPYDPSETVLSYTLSVYPENEREAREYEAKTMLNRLDAGPFDRTMGTLSGGQRKRAALARVLLTPADVLLLDEPTNDLDVETLTILENYLQKFEGPVIAVSHDRYFLDKIASVIFEVNTDGSVGRFIGGYSDYETQKAETEAVKDMQKAPVRPKTVSEKTHEKKAEIHLSGAEGLRNDR